MFVNLKIYTREPRTLTPVHIVFLASTITSYILHKDIHIYACMYEKGKKKKEIEAFDPVEGVGTFVSVDEHAVSWIKTAVMQLSD